MVCGQQIIRAWIVGKACCVSMSRLVGAEGDSRGIRRLSLCSAKLKDGSVAWFPAQVFQDSCTEISRMVHRRHFTAVGVFWSPSRHGVHVQHNCESWLRCRLWLLDSFLQACLVTWASQRKRKEDILAALMQWYSRSVSVLLHYPELCFSIHWAVAFPW